RSGKLSYTLEQMVPMSGKLSFHWSYQLDRISSALSCTGDGECVEAGFDRCDTNRKPAPVCIWGEPWASDVLECADDAACTAASYTRCDKTRVPKICVNSAAAAASSTPSIIHALAARWNVRFLSHAPVVGIGITGSGDEVAPDLALLNAWLSLFSKTNFYDASIGVARQSFANSIQVAIAPATVAADGYGVCMRDFRKYLAWLDSQKVSTKDVGVALESTTVTPASVVFNANNSQTCDALGIWTLMEGVTKKVKKGYTTFTGRAPCIDASAPDAVDKILTNSHAGTVPYAATCQQVHKNYQSATGLTNVDYARFASLACTKTAYVLKLSTGTTVDKHMVYLCPFREAMFLPAEENIAAQHLVSYDPAYAGEVALGTSVLGRNVLPLSGDLATQDDRAPRGVGLVTYEDHLEISGDTSLGSGGMLAKCMEELAMEPPGPMPYIVSEDEGREYYAKLFGGTCFSPGIFYPSLSILREKLIASAVANSSVARLYLRLLQEWLALHAFLAREGRSVGGLSQALQSVQSGSDQQLQALEEALGQTPSIEEVLRMMEMGWGLLLEGRNGAALLERIPAEHIWQPDYRPSGSIGIHPDHEQGVGLPVAIVETATAHLALLEEHLLRTLRDAYSLCSVGGTHAGRDAALATLARGLRYVAVAESLASTIYQNALTFNGTVGWQDRWDAALAEHRAVFAKAMVAGEKLQRCVNPLGISDDELPLFFGDPTGDTGRFFAASDYLVNGWAIPSVEAVHASLEAARRAWLEQRASRIQAQLTEQETERRQEQLAGKYGDALATLCGITDVESKDVLDLFGKGPGKLTADTCFMNMLDASCREEATPDRSLVLDTEALAAIGLQQCVLTRCKQKNVVEYQDLTKLSTDDFINDKELLAELYSSAAVTTECTETKALCAQEKGIAADPLPNPEEIGLAGHMRADCYRGQLGEAFLAIMSAAKDVEIARSSYADAEESYELAMNHCIEISKDFEGINELANSYVKNQEERAKKYKVLGYISAGLKYVAICGAVAAATVATGGAAAPVAVIAAGALAEQADAGLGAYGNDLAQSAAVERAQYERDLLAKQNIIASKQCFSEAAQHRVGMDTAVLRIQRVLIDAETASLRIANLQREVDRTVMEGNAVIKRESGRTVPSIAHHYWLDERLDRFTKDFDWAQRLTYLAMQAVEYEYQQSLPLRKEILDATHPDQLLDVVRALQQEQLARTINGRRPEEATLVLSLRDDILKIQGREDAPLGERDWSANVIFQERLIDKPYQLYVGERYLGQAIPFTIPFVADRCAERLWRVTATLQGDALDVDEPAVTVFLMKRNNFQSQWCAGRGEEDTLQVGAMQPLSRLFHAGEQGGSDAKGITHISAMLQPWLNVPKSDFYRDAYVEGASEELAGRGLYGDYVLLFPADSLLKTGFPLQNVEDVLLRFDFLSVDNIEVNL
ncbi:MAG: hypothetical protein V2A73_10575, partial [Pseudomonadota bacterium]